MDSLGEEVRERNVNNSGGKKFMMDGNEGAFKFSSTEKFS